jgi:hypothetical protein
MMAWIVRESGDAARDDFESHDFGRGFGSVFGGGGFHGGASAAATARVGWIA